MKASSTSSIIPGEQLSEWKSWSPGALDGFAPALTPLQLMQLAQSRRAEGAAPQTVAQAEAELEQPPLQEAASEEAEAKLGYPTAEELEAIHQEAWQAGHDAGQDAGRAEGFQQGLEAGREQGLAETRAEQQARFDSAWRPLERLGQQFGAEISRVEQELSGELLTLAMRLARKIVQAHVQVNERAIADLLQQALSELPATLSQARLRVNPQDLVVAQTFLARETPETQWQWIEDAAIERGGCIIDTASLRLDLSLSSRMAALEQALGLAANGELDNGQRAD